MARHPPPPRPYAPPDDAIGVQYADDWLIIANKPPGLLSVPGRGLDKQDCALSRLTPLFGELHAIHRLDMDTSGLIIFARQPDVAKTLSASFRARTVTKTYDAIVHGHPPGESGKIDLPVGRDWEERLLRRIDHENGKPALTYWSIKCRMAGHTWLKLTPQTGRTHQLRLHLSTMGHPIAGDRLYGNGDGLDRLCLHAGKLHFIHPKTHAETTVFCAAAFDGNAPFAK